MDNKYQSQEIRDRYLDDEAVSARYPQGMDLECVPICDAINKYPSIYTVESCCGHGSKPFRIYMRSEDEESLAYVLYHVSYQRHGWNVEARTDGCADRVSYTIEGPMGDDGYDQSYHIAKGLEDCHEEWTNRWMWIGKYEFKTIDGKKDFFWTGRYKVDGHVVKMRPINSGVISKVVVDIERLGHKVIENTLTKMPIIRVE